MNKNNHVNNKLLLSVLLLIAYTSFATADITDVIDKSYDFNSDGRISLSNINGNVTITACDCKQVHLIATVTASDQKTRDRINVDISASQSRLSVKTKYKKKDRDYHNRNNHSNVVYQLSVPNNVELDQIELVNGNLTISNITGKLDADLVNGDLKSDGMTSDTEVSLVNGDMQITFENLRNTSKIKLNSVNGDIIVNLPSDAGVKVSADTVSGKISNDFGLTVKEGHYVGSDMRGVIGDGTVQLTMENVNGQIKLKSL